ncbi:hypothetical protein HDV05_007301 [Chytridiales sp. JEL 0842]|nr:hypothetical protein HDV05_007301 [Chytridiales sp. JEL 0842]
MRVSALISIIFGSILVSARVNGPCTNSNGVCVSTGACKAAGGSFKSNFCPNDPEDIKCCEKSCSSGGKSGVCKFVSQCGGTTVTGLCPGGNDFKCCLTGGDGGAGKKPDTLGTGCLKEYAQRHATTIKMNTCLTHWSTYANSDPSSDHTTCLAADIWPPSKRHPCAPGAAEYVMNNHAALQVKYVIYGQRIWNPSRDAVKPWNQWRLMEDRGDDTQNHWDHVHVPSTKAAACPSDLQCCGHACTIPTDPRCSQPCQSVPDGSTTCLDDSTYAVCRSNALATVPAQCPPNYVCCAGSCVPEGNYACAGYTKPKVTPSTTVSNSQVTPTVTPTAGNGCTGVADNNMACKTDLVFGFCSNGTFVDGPDFSCPPGSVCCAATNQCAMPADCPSAKTMCADMDPTTPANITPMRCLSETAFTYCSNSSSYISLPPRTCGSRTTCCPSTNTCDFEANCPVSLLPPHVPANPIPSPLTTPPPPFASSNVCAAKPDGASACLNPSQTSLCISFLPTNPTPCPPGTRCCPLTGTCTPPNSASCNFEGPSDVCATVVPPALGVVEGVQTACVSSTQFVRCLDGKLGGAPEFCPAGQFCCGNGCTSAGSVECGAPAPLPAETPGVPVVEPPVEPVVEPAVEPVIEPVVEPVVGPVIEPVVEPVVEPAVEPVVSPV